jgi:hypothetical protein
MTKGRLKAVKKTILLAVLLLTVSIRAEAA